jgi:hypothetical protein
MVVRETGLSSKVAECAKRKPMIANGIIEFRLDEENPLFFGEFRLA